MRSIITKAIALLIAFSTATLAQEKGSFTDARDKKKYKTVKIGEQVWMAENLNYADKNSKCHDNKPANCTKYGRLYDWATAMALPDNCNMVCDPAMHQGQSICPSGWHLPNISEWNVLVNMAGGADTAGKVLKAQSGWNKNGNKNGNGDDKFGFAALPGGFNSSIPSNLGKIGIVGSWWTSDGMKSLQSEKLIFAGSVATGAGGVANSVSKSIGYDRDDFDQGDAPRKDYRSIRCLQNDEKYDAAKKAEEEAKKKVKAEAEAKATKAKVESEAYIKANGGTLTDARDKKTYKIIKIGGQVWLAENLNYEAEKTKCYDDKPESCAKYGRYYNWETAKMACPKDWHLPSNAEWDKLLRFADGTSGTESPYKSQTAGEFLKSADGWNNQGNFREGPSGNGTNKFGFSAMPGDRKRGGGLGSWWSNTSKDDRNAYKYQMGTGNEAIFGYDNKVEEMLNVRCVQGEGPEAKALAEAAVPFKDPRDGKTYKKFVWDYKTWMAENLNYDAKGSKCYDNKPENCAKYGRLYDYETAKKACPAGWHLPSKKEWEPVSYRDIKTGSGWNDNLGKSGGGTNEIGFTALPGGYYNDVYVKANFNDIGKAGVWWVDSTDNRECMFKVHNFNSFSDVINKTGSFFVGCGKIDLYSVRCVSNTPSPIRNTPVTPEVPQLSPKP
jgi:uncharacterized protein (TIGR02145 family)